MSSLDQADITNLNNAESQAKAPRYAGWKRGEARCVFTATGGKAIAAYGMGLTIPRGAHVTKAFYKVLTTFTSATDAATIALKLVSANDIVSAVAISAMGDVWDASGTVITIPTGSMTTELAATTADTELTATVAVEALTAGKLVLWVEWVYFGDLDLT